MKSMHHNYYIAFFQIFQFAKLHNKFTETLCSLRIEIFVILVYTYIQKETHAHNPKGEKNMKTVEMKRNFKNKDGYTRITMQEIPTGKIKYKCSFCYPANESGKFVEYVQNTYEMTKDEANAEYLRNKKKGFTATIRK